MNWLPIRSRFGNRVLLIVGAILAASALALLAFYIIDSWGYASMKDRLLQMILAGCAAYGLVLAVGARQNLKRTA